MWQNVWAEWKFSSVAVHHTVKSTFREAINWSWRPLWSGSRYPKTFLAAPLSGLVTRYLRVVRGTTRQKHLKHSLAAKMMICSLKFKRKQQKILQMFTVFSACSCSVLWNMTVVLILLLILIWNCLQNLLEDHSLELDLIWNIYDHLFTTTSFVLQPFQRGFTSYFSQFSFINHWCRLQRDKFCDPLQGVAFLLSLFWQVCVFVLFSFALLWYQIIIMLPGQVRKN